MNADERGAAEGRGVIGDADPVAPGGIEAGVEAILLSLDRAVPAARLAEGLGLATARVADGTDVGQTAGDVTGDGTSDASGFASGFAAGDASGDRGKRRRKKKAVEASDDSDAAGIERVEAAVAALNAQYEATGRAFRIERVSDGYRVMTLPVYGETIAAFHRARTGGRLTRAGVETLAIIAYKQPLTRAELEAIRGVSCGEVLKTLIERRLVTVKGRAEELGRPMLYGTTKGFLDQFGLASVKDLPTLAELKPGM